MSTVPARATAAPRGLVILGQPVSQSLSPLFQQAALDAAGIAVRYDRRDVSTDALPMVLDEFRRGAVAGNVTMPHKAVLFRLASRHTAVAARTRAVNTFWWQGDTLVGHNTDVAGVEATLTALYPHGTDGDIVVLGAGGAAAAVLVALEQVPGFTTSTVRLVARTPANGEQLVTAVASRATVCARADDVDWPRVTLIVNTTPQGMRPDDPLPCALEPLSDRTALFDLVYRADGTRWVREARARGLMAEDGLRMLVEQGASAFSAWFGVPAPREVMWRALGHPVPPSDAPRL